MAPTAFTFSGIKICIYIEDHLPIHIHAIHAEYETIYELIMDDGKLVDVNLRNVPGREPLPSATNKKVIKFLKKHYKSVVTKWTTLVVYGKAIKATRISGI